MVVPWWGGGCPLVWEVVLLVGKPPQEQAMTPIQTAGVHKTEGGGPLVGGSVLRAGKPPSPKQPMTHIRTSGVHRTVGWWSPGGWWSLVGGPWWVVTWLGVVPWSGEGSSGQESAPLPRTRSDPHPDSAYPEDSGRWSPGLGGPRCGRARPPQVLTARGLPSQVQAQLQLEGVAHAHPHLHPHLAAHAPYLMFPPPPFGLPIASLAESASAAAVVAAAAKSNSKNSSIADLRLKARKHAEALGL